MTKAAKRPAPGVKYETLRIGQGFDVHPMAAGRRLVLGGVRVPHDGGLAGHSDADVLSHAICDAVLGALGLPDIGQRFPADEALHRNRSSLVFLREIAAEMRSCGMELVNLDAVLVAEAPRLQHHLDAMRKRIAAALRSDVERIGIKVKRGEGLGAIGRCEGMMAQAVVLLQPVASAVAKRVVASAATTVRSRRAGRSRGGR